LILNSFLKSDLDHVLPTGIGFSSPHIPTVEEFEKGIHIFWKLAGLGVILWLLNLDELRIGPKRKKLEGGLFFFFF